MNTPEQTQTLEGFRLERYVPALLALTFFTLPLSSTAKSISLSLAVIAILLTPIYRAQLLYIFLSPVGKITLLFFGLIFVGNLWSPATLADKSFVFNKYSKLLYLPLLMLGFQYQKTRMLSIHAFLCAMLITSLLAIFTVYGGSSFLPINPDNIFRNHIMTGLMLAFASYLCLLLGYRAQGRLRIAYGMLGLLFTFHVLFINAGRTGYILYFLMLGICFFQLNTWRKAFMGLLFVSIWLLASYTVSPVMHHRLQTAVEQFYRYQHNDKNTDIGYRIQFHQFAYHLFKQHPWIGNGTASFMYNARVLNPVPQWPDKLIDPHSQYWLVLAELGCLGFAVLGLFFAVLIRTVWRLNQMQSIAFALIIPFIIANLSDSLLFYSGSGYFFILFMGLCLGEETKKISRQSKP